MPDLQYSQPYEYLNDCLLYTKGFVNNKVTICTLCYKDNKKND